MTLCLLWVLRKWSKNTDEDEDKDELKRVIQLNGMEGAVEALRVNQRYTTLDIISTPNILLFGRSQRTTKHSKHEHRMMKEKMPWCTIS